MNNFKLNCCAVFALLMLTACGGGSLDNGSLSLSLTDAPVDGATEVVVKFDAIEIKPKEGNSFTITFEQPKSIDLLALQNGNSSFLLENQPLEAGEYNWMRLLIDADENEMDSYISFEDGNTYSLFIPSANTTGLKLNRSFILPVGGSANFTIDFDLRKSVINPGNNSDDYKLKPTLRIVDNNEVGTISGFIDGQLVTDAACNEGIALYLYSGLDITPDDEGSPTSPLTSVIPVYNANNDHFEYQLSFLNAGDYTLALTCNADNDDPETDEDSLIWSALASVNATVNSNETTEINFE